jgi:hypothetical protein
VLSKGTDAVVECNLWCGVLLGRTDAIGVEFMV